MFVAALFCAVTMMCSSRRGGVLGTLVSTRSECLNTYSSSHYVCLALRESDMHTTISRSTVVSPFRRRVQCDVPCMPVFFLFMFVVVGLSVCFGP
jgi:hypothetical protein